MDAGALAAANTLTLGERRGNDSQQSCGQPCDDSAPVSLIVNANGSGAQTVTTGIHATSITDIGTGSMTVNNASGFTASYALTLAGSASETVINAHR